MSDSNFPPLPADPFGESGAAAGPGLWDTFSRHKWLILLTTAVGGGLGYLAFLKQEPVYVSAAQVRVEQDAMPGDDDLQAGEIAVDTRAAEITSEAVLGPAITGNNLFQRPEFADEPSAMAAILDRLQVERVPETDILRLFYQGESPEEAQEVLDAVTKSYQSYLTSGFGERAKTVLEYIRQARGELDEDLKTMRDDYMRMKEDSPLVRGEDGMVSPHDAEMQRYGEQRNQLRVRIERNQARLKQIDEARRDGSNEAALALLVANYQAEDGSGAPSTEVQIMDELFPLIQQERVLASRYGDRHRELFDLRQRIAALEDHLEEKLGGNYVPRTNGELLDLYVRKLRLDLGITAAELAELDNRFEEERKLAAADGSEELKLNTLDKQIAEKEALFHTINDQLNKLNLTPEDVKGFSVRILSPPGPGTVSEAAMPLFAGSGAAAGFLLGFGVAFLLVSFDKRFASVADLQEVTGAPVVAHTPVISGRAKKVRPTHRRLEGADEYVVAPPDPTMLTIHPEYDAGGRYVEACRRIRASLFFASRGNPLKVVQMTSPSPEDGKSTTAANLAVVIADSGRRTLLLDCDFRKPKQHTLFGIDPNAPGAADILSGGADLADCVREVGVDGLHVLPCGSIPGNASELLDADVFSDFLDMLQERYDFIVIDSPPVLAVADPLMIASRADGVLMSMRLDGKTRARVRSVVTQLERVGANLLGTVVTGVASGSTGEGPYKYDSYGGYAYACGKTEPEVEKKYERYRLAAGPADRVTTRRPKATIRATANRRSAGTAVGGGGVAVAEETSAESGPDASRNGHDPLNGRGPAK